MDLMIGNLKLQDLKIAFRNYCEDNSLTIIESQDEWNKFWKYVSKKCIITENYTKDDYLKRVNK